MNFLIEKKLLYRALQKIVSIISGRPRLPILSHILLEIGKDYLRITATDLDIEIIEQIFFNDIYSVGSSTVSGRKFFEICRGFSECAKISVELINNKLVISSGSSKFFLSTFFVEDFPKLELWNSTTELEISRIVLKEMMELTQFSMGSQDVRYYLNGMLIEIKEHTLRIVSTDGYRLATCSVSIESLLSLQSVIVSRKGVSEILRLLNVAKETSLVNVQTSKYSIRLKINNCILTSKLIDGIFPNYQNILKITFKNVLEVACVRLKQSLKRAAIISSDKIRIVQFILTNNFLKIVARNFENEVSEETLDVCYTGQNIEISFNVDYLLDILNVMDAQIIRFFLNDALSSVKVEGIPKLHDTTYIVMPIRI